MREADAPVKGAPPEIPAAALEVSSMEGLHALRDLSPPLALLQSDALDGNRAFLRRLLARTRALYAPHGKTTMSPELFRLQLEDGAWGITLATTTQVATARRFGSFRVLIANQIVDPRALLYLASELRRDPAFELWAYVDSVDGVRLWQQALGDGGRPLPVLLEVGHAGGRAGCRGPEAALEVARSVSHAGALRLRGIAGFEGILQSQDGVSQDEVVRRFVAELVETAQALDAADLFAPGEVLLSAGGSAFYDLVATGLEEARLSRPHRVLLRSGCALIHDDGTYAEAFRRLSSRWPEVAQLAPPPQAALELWAEVLSCPEPTRVVAGLGKRDASHDGMLPRPKAWFRRGLHREPQPIEFPLQTSALNDQHALLDATATSPLRVGDLVGFGVSHPCLTFDRWRLLFVVGADYRIRSGVRTFF